jgi:hypothetical protein
MFALDTAAAAAATLTTRKRTRRLFTPGVSNPKTAKGEETGYSVMVLHLAPHNLGGRGTVCRWATVGCKEACLNTAGRGGIGAGTDDDIRAGRTNGIQAARIRRTQEFFDGGADAFVARLAREVRLFERRCRRKGLRAAIRLNGTSDIPWERVAPALFMMFPDVVFYDYTKAPLAARPSLPANYRLTVSFSGENWAECLEALAAGRNVAVVFDAGKGQELPAEFAGYPVLDGDVNDLRFLDPAGHIVGLRAKGRARKQVSPFIIRTATLAAFAAA